MQQQKDSSPVWMLGDAVEPPGCVMHVLTLVIIVRYVPPTTHGSLDLKSLGNLALKDNANNRHGWDLLNNVPRTNLVPRLIPVNYRPNLFQNQPLCLQILP